MRIEKISTYAPGPPPTQPPPTPRMPNSSLADEQAGQRLSERGSDNATWTALIIGGVSALSIILLVAAIFGLLLFKKQRLKSIPPSIGAQQGISLEELREARPGSSTITLDSYDIAMASSSSDSSPPAYQVHHFTLDDDGMDKGTSMSLPALREDHPLEDLSWRMPAAPEQGVSRVQLGQDRPQWPGPLAREESGASSVGEASINDSSRSDSSALDWDPDAARERLYQSLSLRRSERI